MYWSYTFRLQRRGTTEVLYDMRCTAFPSRNGSVPEDIRKLDPDLACWTIGKAPDTPDLRVTIERGCVRGSIVIGSEHLWIAPYDYTGRWYSFVSSGRTRGAADTTFRYQLGLYYEDGLSPTMEAAVSFAAKALHRWHQPGWFMCRDHGPFW